MIKTFKDLNVYKRSKELFSELVKVTKEFPVEGKYLAVQLNRSANSVHSNIAEGFGRSAADFKNYLRRALGSNNETISHLGDAFTSGFISEAQRKYFEEGYTVLGKQIYRLRENWQDFKET